MKTNHSIEILKCILSGTAPSKDAVSAVSLYDLYDFCSLNKLIPLTAGMLSGWQCTTAEEQELVAWWKNEAARLVFLEYKKLSLVKKLTEAAKERGLSLLFFKGYLLSSLYSDFTLRNSSDTDILVKKEQFTKVTALLEELQYIHDASLDTENVYTYLYKEADYTVHKIELHTSLYEDAHGAQLNTLKQLALDSPKRTVLCECCGLQLLTLGHTEHFIYQIFHMVKHLACHGFPARYLSDTVLFIKAHISHIDWGTVAEAMKCLGYSLFYENLCSIMIHYFDAPDCILGSRTPLHPSACNGLLEDILHFGARGLGDKFSDGFYFFEQYIEMLEQKAGTRLKTISFDGSTVPEKVVPLKIQQNEALQNRIRFLQTLELI